MLKNASSATVLSQQVMASYQRCIAARAASDFMGRVFTSGSSLAANQTAHIANLLGSSLVTLFNICKQRMRQAVGWVREWHITTIGSKSWTVQAMNLIHTEVL